MHRILLQLVLKHVLEKCVFVADLLKINPFIVDTYLAVKDRDILDFQRKNS